jgi:Zn-dependent protease with chaperone function
VGRIEPVRPTLLYRLWILIVAAVMVTLPLIYVAIIGLVIAAVAYHAIHSVSIFSAVRGSRALQVAAVVYIAPLLAGAMVVVLMIKPLFARPARGPKSRALDPGAEPLLYAFVDGVCDSVGAPRPARIEVDCQVNASAHRDGGILGVLGGKLILTIGLPFAAGVSLKQFAGVLAHEFGHFSQGAGMRLYGLIMRINLWFARVVYQRDEWDANLEAWSSDEQGLVVLLAGVTRLAVWMARRVLWVLMQIGHVVSGFLSRQMEYDADRYEARMVGAACFAETMWRFRVMSLAENGAVADLNSSWQQRRLPDNFPKLVMANIPQIPEAVVSAFRHEMETATSGLFSTHPSDKDRIARARREAPGDGIFHLDGPATDVFRDFDALARSVSFDTYRASLGSGISREQLYEVAELVESQAAVQEGSAAAGRFFLGALDMRRRLPMPGEYPATPADISAAQRALAAVRQSLQSAREGYQASSRRLEELGNRLVQTELATALLKADVKIKASDFDLRVATEQAAKSARDRAEAELRQLDESESTDPFATAAVGRLVGALGLLEDEGVAGGVPDGRDRRDEARALYRCTAHLASVVMPQLARLARSRSVLVGALQIYEAGKDPKDQSKINAVLRAAASLRDGLDEIRWKVGDGIAYPFEHADEDVTLGKFAFPPLIPAKDDIGGLLEASGEAINRLAGLYGRALGRLALAAEEVERALGLPPIVVEEVVKDA